MKFVLWMAFSWVGVLYGTSLDTWLPQQREISLQRLLQNISVPGSRPGAIIASPSKSEPDYYYHWVRDAGLVTQSLLSEYFGGNQALLPLLYDQIDFSLLTQQTALLKGSLGIPRFFLDGNPAIEAWPSPQDDGPALRAIAMIRLAHHWLDEGQGDFVRAKLYHKDGKSLIKTDLEYTSHRWQNTSYDLWEELHGRHFFAELAQRRALRDGSTLAFRLGDYEAGGWYIKQAEFLETELLQHWDESKGYILSTLYRDGGIGYKSSNLDTSVLLAVLNDSFDDDGFFSVDDDRVLATAHQLNETFRKLYPINAGTNLPPLIGRYAEDQYDGHFVESNGNPWVLTTAAMAELYFRLRQALIRNGEIEINSRNFCFYESLEKNIRLREKIEMGSPKFNAILESLRRQGDGYLMRIQQSTGADGAFSEQIDRTSGTMRGAPHLTWSYASFLAALRARPSSAALFKIVTP